MFFVDRICLAIEVTEGVAYCFDFERHGVVCECIGYVNVSHFYACIVAWCFATVFLMLGKGRLATNIVSGVLLLSI